MHPLLKMTAPLQIATFANVIVMKTSSFQNNFLYSIGSSWRIRIGYANGLPLDKQHLSYKLQAFYVSLIHWILTIQSNKFSTAREGLCYVFLRLGCDHLSINFGVTLLALWQPHNSLSTTRSILNSMGKNLHLSTRNWHNQNPKNKTKHNKSVSI